MFIFILFVLFLIFEIIKDTFKRLTVKADIVKLKDILKSYPTHPEATLALAEVLSHKGNYSEAVEEYYNLIKSKPDYTEKAMEGSKNIIKKFPGQFLARQFLIENYLKEEIQIEQVVRKLDPFRDFLEIAALMSGCIINYNKIAKEYSESHFDPKFGSLRS